LVNNFIYNYFQENLYLLKSTKQKFIGGEIHLLVEKKSTNLNEKRYHFLIDNILDVVGELDLNGIFTYVNPYIYDELGYQADEIIGREIYEFVHPDDVKKITKFLLSRPKSHDLIPEIRLKNDKNQFIWYEIKARRIKDYNNQRKILITLKNISKVKVLEEKLEKKEENYQKITNSIPEIQFWKVLTPSKYERAVRTLLKMLYVIVENIPQCVFWKDTNFKYLGCNGKYSEFIGIEHPESIIGKTDEDLLSNRENIQQIRESETSFILSGKPLYHTNESWIIEKGENIWLDINRVPLTDAKGDVNGILVTFEEITDRKIAEEKLRNSEKKYKNLSNELETIMDIIPSMIDVKNKSDIYTRVNQVFADYLKLEKEDIIGKSTFDLFPQELATNLKRDDLEVIKNGIPKLNIEETLEFPVGKVSGIISKMPYYNEKDEINGVIGFAIDISERKELEQRLIKSEEKYRNLFNNSPNMIALIDLSGKLLDSNESALKFTGAMKNKIIGKSFQDFEKFFGGNLPILINKYKEILKNGSMESFEIQLHGKNKRKTWVNLQASLIEIKNEMFIQVIMEDITDRKKAEQELKESEELLRLERDNLTNILNSMKDGVYIVNQNYDIEFVNPVLIEEFGPFELKKCFKYFHDREEVCPWCKNQDVFAGKTVRWEWFSFKNQKTYDLVDTPLKNLDGSISKLEIFHDITERTKAEQKLKESEEKYRNLVENAQEGVWAVDENDDTIFVNPKICEMLGYTKDEVMSKNLHLFLEDSMIELINSYRECREKSLKDTYDIEFTKKDGTILYTSVKAAPILGENGEFKGSFAYITDITERKKAENEIKNLAKFPAENPNPVLRVSKEFVLYANQAGNKLFQVIVGNKIPLKLENYVRTAFNENKNLNSEVQLNSHIYSIFITPIEGTEYANVYGMDITERTIAEKKLKESEEKYRLITENANDIIAVLDDKFRPEYINETPLNKILGYNSADLIGTLDLLVIHPDDRKMVLNGLIKGSEVGEGISDARLRHKDGRYIWVESRGKTFIDGNGEKKILINMRNITERKKTEQQLKESEEKYRILIETAVMGLVEFDVIRNKVSYINPKLLDILGYKKKELLDEKIFMEIVHPEDLENLIISREEKNVEFRIVTKDGKIKWLSGTRNNLFNKEGKLISARLWLQDSTESKEVEEIKSNLLTRFSHEFKTPLISIKGFADFLLTEYKVNLDEKILSFLRRIKEGSNRLEALINSFIESSQLEKTVIRMNLKQEDVSDLVQEVLLELEGYIGMREHTINVSLYEKLITTIDKEKIYTVLSNILINAIDYTPQGGKISIKSSIDKNFLTISVKDNGIGLTEEEKKYLFKPFGKIERYGMGWDITVGGIGMGLYISKEIIELHGGKIWSESEGRSKGSEFLFSLPIK